MSKQKKLMTLEEFGKNPENMKKLAKYVTQFCFRNTKLEDLHSGKVPSSKTGDYKDVKVVSPFGEIAWNELSRFDDKEMKMLMKDAANHTYTLLAILLRATGWRDEFLRSIADGEVLEEWDDPELLDLASFVKEK